MSCVALCLCSNVLWLLLCVGGCVFRGVCCTVLVDVLHSWVGVCCIAFVVYWRCHYCVVHVMCYLVRVVLTCVVYRVMFVG